MGSNWKGVTGAIATMLVGVLGMLLGWVDPSSSYALSVPEGIAAITAGFSLFGIRKAIS